MTVHYTGTSMDGKKSDSSVDRNETAYSRARGGIRVIAGWDLGVAQMKIGDSKKMTIPPGTAHVVLAVIPARFRRLRHIDF